MRASVWLYLIEPTTFSAFSKILVLLVLLKLSGPTTKGPRLTKLEYLGVQENLKKETPGVALKINQ